MSQIGQRFAVVLVALFVMAVATTNAAVAQVKLQIRYAEGAKSAIQTELRSKQSLTLPNRKAESESTRLMVTSSQAGRRREDGTLEVRNRVERLKASMTTGQFQFEFDSAKADEPTDLRLRPLFDSHLALSRASWTAIHDKTNHVVAIEGLEKAADGLPDAIKSQLSSEAWKKIANQELDRLPTKPVRLGEKWSHATEADLGGGQSLRLDSELEYAGPTEVDGKRLEQIRVVIRKVTYSMGKNSPLPVKLKHSRLEAIDSEGEILFDAQRGLVALAHEQVHIAGEIVLQQGETEFTGKLDLQLESETKLLR